MHRYSDAVTGMWKSVPGHLRRFKRRAKSRATSRPTSTPPLHAEPRRWRRPPLPHRAAGATGPRGQQPDKVGFRRRPISSMNFWKQGDFP